MTRFADQVLLATGAGSGIAAAVAERFAAEGGRVAVVDADADKAQRVADRCSGLALACDVSDEAAVQEAVATAAAELGRIDCVVNAAGHAYEAAVEDMGLADWNRMIAVHATGTFLVCRSAVAHLRGAGGGSIVNVASIAALVARPRAGAYSAAKGAIVAFSRQLALDLAADGIRVNAIAPGPVHTPLTEPLWAGRAGGDAAAGARATAAGSILKRVGSAEEIAEPICFLLSSEASFMTGMTMSVDGGQTAL